MKRKMLEPRKDELRWQLEVARAQVAYLSAPWWVHLRAWLLAFGWRARKVAEVVTVWPA